MVDDYTRALLGIAAEAPQAAQGTPSRQASRWLWIALTAAVAGGAGALGIAPSRDVWRHLFLGADVYDQVVAATTFVGVLGVAVGGICGAVAGVVHGAVTGSAWRAVVSMPVGVVVGVVFGAIGGALTPLLIYTLRETLPPEGAAGLAWAIAGALAGWLAYEWKREVDRMARQKASAARGDGGGAGAV
jgi:hypothetical protein